MMLWDSRTLTLIKTYVTERPVNAVTMSPLLDHVVIGGGQDASSVTTTDHRAGKFEAKFFDKGVPEQKLRGHLGSFGVTGNLALQPMYTLSGWWTFLPSFEEATENIPRPDDNITRTLHLFNLRGFNTRETTSLLGNPFTSTRGLLFADQQLMAEEKTARLVSAANG